MLADCLHSLAALGPGGFAALLTTMLLSGLAVGLGHCTVMCAPFVLSQASLGTGREGTVLTRLSGGALLPYHAGRAVGYGLLGAASGGLSGMVVLGSGLRWLLALLLLLSALLMAAQALPGLARRLPSPGPVFGLPRRLLAWVQARAVGPGGPSGFLFGLLLSALPCGALYGALAAAAAAGSALAGGLAMVAFVAGTAPALIALGYLGRFFERLDMRRARQAARAILLINVAMLVALAANLVLR